MTDEDTKIQRYLGFAEEATRGVAEQTPEMHCDAKTLNPGFPDDSEMTYKGSMGRGRNVHRPGPYQLGPSAEVGTDIKILARQLYFALGNVISDTVEGAGTGLNPSKVYYYDKSGDSFSSELADFISATANDVDVPGHAAGEVDDYLAIGYSQKFSRATIVIGVPKTDVSTIVWEYWNGTAWVALTVTDGTTGFTAAAGSHDITFTAPTDWAVKSLNKTVAAYYIRARCSAFTSAANKGTITSGTVGTVPDTSTQYVYSSDKILLPSQTLFMGIDINEYILAGCVTDKFELTADNEFLTMKLTSKGQLPSMGIFKELDELLLNSDYPLAYYEVNLHMRSLGSTTPWGDTTRISQDIKKLTTSIENSISDSDGQRIGSRFSGFLPAGDRNITLQFDRVYVDNKFLELMWGSEGGPTDESGSAEMEFMVEINAGIYGKVQIWIPRAIVTSSPVDSSGKDAIVPTIKVDAYNQKITIPSSTPKTVVTDCLATFTLNFPDTTSSFNGPAWAMEI